MADSLPWFFIINPCAGGGRPQRLWPSLSRALCDAGINHHAAFTDQAGHATDLVVTALEEGVRRFAVIGGDGTLNEVVNAFCRQRHWLQESSLTAFPCGTGNDWAAQYHLPDSIPGFIAMLQSPGFCPQDVGRVSFSAGDKKYSHYFANFIGAGFDSYLLAQMGEAGGDKWRYFYYVLKCLKRFAAPVMTLELNGESLTQRSLMTMICIGKRGGAGMLFAPTADMNDGLLDILRIRDMPFLRRLLSLAYLFNGRINRHPAVDAWRTTGLGMCSESAMQFQCDGELVGSLPVVVDLVPDKLTVVVSQAAS